MIGTLVVGAGLAGACGGEQEAAAPVAPLFKPMDPAQAANIFAQPGASRYAGVLPCADCSGIRTELMLLQDPDSGEPQIYELRETHLGSMSTEGEKTITSRGKWAIVRGTPADANATVYRLESGDTPAVARSFERVSEQELRPLDAEGRRVAAGSESALMRVAEPPVLSFPAPSAPTAASAAAAPGVQQPAAMVTDLASGWPVTLRVGQQMTVRLTADRAAGARWSLRVGSDGGLVALDGEPAYEPRPAGGSGVEVFRLTAVKPGTIALTFDYRKTTDAAPTRTVSYPVTVQ